VISAFFWPRPLATGGSAVENKERWMELCAQAAKEEDSERLFKLVQEINTLLEEKETRLKRQNPKAEN
jgi:hypothetical protein